MSAFQIGVCAPPSTFNAPLALTEVTLAIADFSRATAKVDRIADPAKRRRAWELLADYAEVIYAQAADGIARLDADQRQPFTAEEI